MIKTVSERKKEYKREYFILYPWMRAYTNAKSRCSTKSHKYYKKGIQFLMTPEDFKTLWFRNRAYLLDEPSIDRIKSNLHYTLDNCRFIERRINCGIGGSQPRLRFSKKEKEFMNRIKLL